MGVSPSAQGGIEIFDDATARSTKAAGGGNLYDSLQWGSDDTALYAANNESSGFDFYILTVSSTGVVLDTDLSGDIGAYSKRIHFDPSNKLIYDDFGDVVDTSGNPVGSYSTSNEGVMVPDSTLDKAFFAEMSDSTTATIEVFDQKKFTLQGSIVLQGVSAPPSRIVRFGNNGLAFITRTSIISNGSVYLIGGNFVH
jgi:hypothetical protein